jgi:hypothetical protein
MTPSPDLTHSPVATTIADRGPQSIGRSSRWDIAVAECGGFAAWAAVWSLPLMRTARFSLSREWVPRRRPRVHRTPVVFGASGYSERSHDRVHLVDSGEAGLLDRLQLIDQTCGLSCRAGTHDHGGSLGSCRPGTHDQGAFGSEEVPVTVRGGRSPASNGRSRPTRMSSGRDQRRAWQCRAPRARRGLRREHRSRPRRTRVSLTLIPRS